MSIYSMGIFFSYFLFFTQDRIKDFLDSLLSSISVLGSPFNYSSFSTTYHLYKNMLRVCIVINRNRIDTEDGLLTEIDLTINDL